MDFVEPVGDTTNLPVFFIGGVARAEIVDNCMVRITLLRVPEPGTTNMPECQLIWTIPAWCSARSALQHIAEMIAKLGLNLSLESSSRPANVNVNHH